jgi:hypothetical protein
MVRRWAGWLAYVVVGVLVVVAPGLAGRPVGGEAAAMVLPTAPATGACLGVGGSVSSLGGVTPVGWAGFVDCAQVKSGEVVWVRELPSGTPLSGYQQLARALGPSCTDGAGTFVGMRTLRTPMPPDGSADAGTVLGTADTSAPARSTSAGGGPGPVGPDDPAVVEWRPGVSLGTRWVIPDRLQRAAGRAWLACVVEPGWRGSYDGSVRDALAGGRLPAAYGVCWSPLSSGSGRSLEHCRQPHEVQLLATATVPQHTAAVAQACRALATRLLGRPDPTAGGAVRVSTGDGGADGTDGRVVTCSVTATTGQLIDGVFGLGDHVVPVLR